ncbi:nucleoside/nucleotide kinase family protein [Epibacterium sp. SM1979]|uniref:Nucleoside/nucleotide kinase family protein n=1 Tax=Tritonibacter litoralis TaxID=2662264 RepID=A0A843YFH6_9RHOB|nr:nucleoside/nucleotide kinase family protein [Tritonibacter litoralis]
MLPQVLTASRAGRRRLVALVGPPASGKSTLAGMVAEQLTAAGTKTVVVPMDGFHLDNSLLYAQGLLPRKGAPETFDVGGLLRVVSALAETDTVYFPKFDRNSDIAVAGAGVVSQTCDTVIVEGNYLLFDAFGWRDLQAYWDFSIQLDVPLPVLRDRLIDRWLSHGLTHDQAIDRAEQNDLRNAERIVASALEADVTVSC